MCTKSFASLVLRVVGLFTSPREVNKPTAQNTRDANDFVHRAKRLARKKETSASRVEQPGPDVEISEMSVCEVS